MSKKLSAIKAARRNYKPEIKHVSFEVLPFVRKLKRSSKKAYNNWDVKPTDDYGVACSIGTEYAAHFAQYLKDNRCMAGSNLLGHIALDIDFSDTSPAKGYWVGFFSYLENLIYEAAREIDIFSDVDEVHRATASIVFARMQEAKND
ncbi:hypothetical protein H8K32_19785 [Undibacterium jejuense]|uniref:Uncharacterized protein n=1 Tax=Undibacterium jejuense TaxID=1344949 RepID=A0A923KJJ8_9BURK|nr:hypothetical protein [Undibacterium jejuense]MBC3864342.1 hypothetical protein [Undibacterium jejuense]